MSALVNRGGTTLKNVAKCTRHGERGSASLTVGLGSFAPQKLTTI
jgi:hypothetical protein